MIHLILMILKWYLIVSGITCTAFIALAEWRHQRTRRALRHIHDRHEAAARADALNRAQRAVRLLPFKNDGDAA
jgi:hypothetical protein